jgi:hypothetical protein
LLRAACMKTSRMMISSLSAGSISGVTGRPAAVNCCVSASMRALGTGCPLTMAMFCACAATVTAPRNAAVAATFKSCFFMENKRGKL